MVNKRKVRLMARTAMYEKHEGHTDFRKAGFYKGDYIGMHMLLSGAAVTIGYLLCLVVICVYNFDFLINNLTILNYRQMFSNAVIVYVLILIAYMIGSYFLYAFRYENGQHGIRLYMNRLKKIQRLNKMEKNEIEEGNSEE